MKAYIAELKPRYELLTQQHLSKNLIPVLHEEKKDEIKKELDSAVAMAVTTDMWTSSNDSYMGVAFYFADSNFNFHWNGGTTRVTLKLSQQLQYVCCVSKLLQFRPQSEWLFSKAGNIITKK